MMKVKTGLDRLLEEADLQQVYTGRRLGLLSNQASIDQQYRYAKDQLQGCYGADLKILLSPQHGFFAEKQDNMIESDHTIDASTSLPVYSLYGKTRRPTKEMFDQIDVLFVDLVDVGTRVYTFMYTVAYCLEAAALYDVEVVILDRPNPIGGVEVEGNILRSEYTSFVGLFPIPMRHGMTLGELGLYMNDHLKKQASLSIIEMSGWVRTMYYEDTGLVWAPPSPNMPSVETAVVYPGQVIWEGTNVSEGRGTTRPFELVGAPGWDIDTLKKRLEKTDLPGCYFRPIIFEPTSGKWAGQSCRGFFLHTTDRRLFKPYRTSLALYQAAMLQGDSCFGYKQPPYEYEYEKLPMDLILGDRNLRKKIENGVDIIELDQQWQDDLNDFKEIRREFLLYSI